MSKFCSLFLPFLAGFVGINSGFNSGPGLLWSSHWQLGQVAPIIYIADVISHEWTNTKKVQLINSTSHRVLSHHRVRSLSSSVSDLIPNIQRQFRRSRPWLVNYSGQPLVWLGDALVIAAHITYTDLSCFNQFLDNSIHAPFKNGTHFKCFSSGSKHDHRKIEYFQLFTWHWTWDIHILYNVIM